MPEYQVKGSTIRNKFDYVESCFGSLAKEDMVRFFKSKYGKGLFPIFNNVWYPFDFYVELLEFIVRSYFEGDLKKLKSVGAESARDALNTIYRSFQCGLDYLTFLRRISKLHGLFYSQGKISVRIHENQRGCHIVHSEKPRYAMADLYVACGFYQETARLHELKNVRCSFDMGPEGAVFTLLWD